MPTVLRAALVLALLPAAVHAQITPAQQKVIDETTEMNRQVVKLLNVDFRFDEALAVAKRALAIQQRALGANHGETAVTLGNIAWCYHRKGELNAAKETFEKVLAVQKAAYGERSLNYAGTLSDLGVILTELGDLQGAKVRGEAGLAIRKQLLGVNHADTATSMHHLGSTYQALGDYQAARPLLEQTLAIRRKLLGEKNIDTTEAMSNYANLLVEMGDVQAALPYYEKALAIGREVLGEKHLGTAGYYNNLGSAWHTLSEFEKARPLLEKSLAIRLELLGDKNLTVASSFNNLGMLYQSLGDLAKAKEYLDKSLAILTAALGENHPDIATANNNLSELLKAECKFAEAKPYAERAQALARKSLGPAHPTTSYFIAALMSVEAALGKWERAGALALESRKITRSYIANTLPTLSPEEQLNFLVHNNSWQTYRAISLGLHADAHPALAPLTAEFLANYKGLAQESLAERTALALGAADPALKAGLDELSAFRSRLAALAQGGGTDAEFKQLEKLQARERELATGIHLKLGRPTAGQWTTLEQIRARLKPTSVLVDIGGFQPYDFNAKPDEVLGVPHYWAWITPPAGQGRTFVVDLGETGPIHEAVAAYQEALKLCQSPDKATNPIILVGESEAEKQLRASLAELGKLVLDPLYPHLKDRTEIVLSPEGHLWLAPWAALPVPESPEQYAVERWSIRCVTAAREIAVERGKPADGGPRIFANPNYNLAVKDVPAQLATVFGAAGPTPTPVQADPTLVAMADLRGRSAQTIANVGFLPGTATEAAAVAPKLKTFCGVEPKTYAGNVALEGIIKRIRSPRVLVVATHGFFLPDQAEEGQAIENPLLRCGLLFAGCNTRDKLPAGSKQDDGVLSGMEITGIDLRGTELVVLSACETGLGKVNDGEGVAGLRQAFQLAGARAVVATLWQIPDQETVKFMDDFFTELAAGRGKAESLRNAQLATIKSRREKFGAAHPLYWAAFTLTGAD